MTISTRRALAAQRDVIATDLRDFVAKWYLDPAITSTVEGMAMLGVLSAVADRVATRRPRVLIVTGSRALAEGALAEWAARRLATAFEIVGPDIVVHGGAIGPDRIADGLAREFGATRLRFELDGELYRDDARVRRWAEADRSAMDPKRWPLYRNSCMVDYCVREALARDYRLFLYGLHAPWSKTSGTLFTARLTAQNDNVSTWVDTAPTETAA